MKTDKGKSGNPLRALLEEAEAGPGEKMSLEKRMELNLTPKQAGFCHHYLQKGNRADAIMAVYDSHSRNSARVMAHRNLHRPKVKEYIRFLIDGSDMVPAALGAIREALDAKVVYRGQETDSPDHRAQLKAADRILELSQRVEEQQADNSKSDGDQQLIKLLSTLPTAVLEWMQGQDDLRIPDPEEWTRIMEEDRLRRMNRSLDGATTDGIDSTTTEPEED